MTIEALIHHQRAVFRALLLKDIMQERPLALALFYIWSGSIAYWRCSVVDPSTSQ